MGREIAVCGKGGVGKTAVVAMIAKVLLENGSIKALVIDADPSGGLSMTLSLPSGTTVNDIRKEVIRDAKRRRVDKADVTASADYHLFDALTEHGNLAFLSIGRPEEEGCYCQVNTLLRKAIELLSGDFELTVIDAEAGIEQINRRVIKKLDNLILLSDLSAKGLQVADTIKRVADDSIQYSEVSLLVNRVSNEKELEGISRSTSLPLNGWIPEDATIRRYDQDGISFFELPVCPALSAVKDFCSELDLMG